jgi:hypothetical protein
MKKFQDPLTNMGINNKYMARVPFIRRRLLAFKDVYDQLYKFIDATIEEHKQRNDYKSGEVG